MDGRPKNTHNTQKICTNTIDPDPQQKKLKPMEPEALTKKEEKEEKKNPPHIQSIVFPQGKCACCVPEDNGKHTQLRPNSLLTSFPASKIKDDNPKYQLPATLSPCFFFSARVYPMKISGK